jgi:acid phosphatase
VALLALALALAACGDYTLAPRAYTPTPGALPAFSHVFVVVMENHAYDDIIGNTNDAPFINELAGRYGLATRYFAITHPSLPNYLALLGGETFGVQSDCETCYVSAPNLVDALEAGHKTWRAYMESMPSPCFVGSSGTYAQKHNPFIYFDDIRTNAQRCQNVVPMDGLQSDLAQGNVSDFTWITPNLCDDMHDCSTRDGDTWLSQWVPRILASAAWKQNGALFLVWDEGTDDSGCCQYASGGHIPLLVISPLVKAGTRSSTPYDHYSLLRTICAAWGLTPPGHAADATTAPLDDFFSRR